MSKFLKALAKVGLVELETNDGTAPTEPVTRIPDDAEIDLLLHEKARETPAAKRPAAPVSAPARVTSAAPLEVIQGTPLDDRPFEQIYADAGIPPSAFPAEKLLKVLAGLAALDANTRKAAVLAMDAADDAWSIDDSIIDARRKIDVLQQEKSRLVAGADAAGQEAETEIQARDKYQEEATAEIRKQIAELESMLEKEVAKVAEEKAAIAQKASAAREAAQRESLRIDKEIQRLYAIDTTFSAPAKSGV